MKELEAIRDVISWMRHEHEHRRSSNEECPRCELEALLPALAQQIEALEGVFDALAKHCRGRINEPTTVKNVAQIVHRICALDAEKEQHIQRLEAEIAALREPMSCTHPRACWNDGSLPAGLTGGNDWIRPYCTACEHERLAVARHDELMTCGHPKACWQATKPDSVDAVVGYRCVACEDKRLAVAATRLDATKFMRLHWGDSDMVADEWSKLVSKADAQALDARDAEASQWMQHKQDCASRIWMGRACDCGLDSFLRRAK